MAKVSITESYLENIADAIRTKTGSSTTYKPSEMADAIYTISGGGGIIPTGTLSITSNGTHNVYNYASANVNVPNSYSTEDEGKVVSNGELIGQTSQTYTSNNTYDTTTVNSITINVPTSGGTPIIDSLAVTPTETAQTFNSSSVDGYKPVTVSAISSTYIGSGITQRSSSDLTASGATITVPAGYYSAAASKSIASGSVTAPSSISGTSATVSTGTNTLTLTKTVSVTPSVTTAGYISSGTAGNSSVSLTASVTTKAAATITPGTSNQTIASGTYLTGTQTISGDANLVSGNIISGKSIFGVSGSVVLQNVYTGSSAPSSSTGSNGDIYIQS